MNLDFVKMLRLRHGTFEINTYSDKSHRDNWLRTFKRTITTEAITAYNIKQLPAYEGFIYTIVYCSSRNLVTMWKPLNLATHWRQQLVSLDLQVSMKDIFAYDYN